MKVDDFSKFAILLAAYNGEKWLVEQIESILHQTDVAPTIFISLDLSDDDSLALCEKLAEQNSNIQLLPYGERFGGAGKNFYRLIRDVDFSDFDYVALSDQDDILILFLCFILQRNLSSEYLQYQTVFSDSFDQQRFKVRIYE